MATTTLVRRANVQQYLPDINKNYVWGAVLVLAGMVGLYYWGKNNGTIKQAEAPIDTQPETTTDPKTGNTTVVNPITDGESKEIVRLATSFNTQLGWWGDVDTAILSDLLGSSDRVFVGTYNYFNTTFSSPPDTLKTQIDFYSNFKIWIGEINHLMDSIVARMDKLGLK